MASAQHSVGAGRRPGPKPVASAHERGCLDEGSKCWCLVPGPILSKPQQSQLFTYPALVRGCGVLRHEERDGRLIACVRARRYIRRPRIWRGSTRELACTKPPRGWRVGGHLHFVERPRG